MNKQILVTVFALCTLYAQDRTFHLKSGDKVTGAIVSETDSTYIINTSFGSVTISKGDVKPEEAYIFLKSGDKLRGIIVSESDEGLTVKAKFGQVFIERDQIERIDFKSMGRTRGAFSRPGQAESGRWYYGSERLIDIYFDPSGYTLEENVLYLSGLSWGYGLTDNFQITSRWGSYFYGDLNFRPKFMVFKKGDMKSEQSLSVGFHYHLRGLPEKYEYKEVQDYNVEWFGDTTWYGLSTEWVRVGSDPNRSFFDDNPYGGKNMWLEFFGAYTVSNLKKSGQGRINHTIGGLFTYYPGFDLMPRAYYAVYADVRRNLKLIFEGFWDPYWPSALEMNENKKISDLDFDFGFIYAYSEKFRIGIHFQRPWVAFYYKF